MPVTILPAEVLITPTVPTPVIIITELRKESSQEYFSEKWKAIIPSMIVAQSRKSETTTLRVMRIKNFSLGNNG